VTAIPAGAKVRASQLNAALPIIGRALADVSVTSSTALVDADTGLAVALDADSIYIWDAYLAYDAGATGDLKLAWTVPSGTTGHWCGWGLATGTTGSIGDMAAIRAAGYGSGNTLSFGGSASFSGFLALRAAGYIDTAAAAGTLQLQFAQNPSNATATILKGGSWVCARKVG
jgi:hypothetical protein